MANRKLGSGEIINRNRKYLAIAQDNGCFQDSKGDIGLCKDWVIALWIDELEDKDDINKFVNEQIPAFKRWFNAGIKTNMIGRYYHVLKMAEEKNIEINRDSADCLMQLAFPLGMHDKIGKMEDPELIRYFSECIDNLIELNKAGVPLCRETGANYNILMELKEMGKPVNYDTFLFFAPGVLVDDEYKMQLYESRELTGKKFGYYPATIEEVELLAPYFIDNHGYNVNRVESLEAKKEKAKEKLKKYPNMEPRRKKDYELMIIKLSGLIDKIKSRNILQEYYNKFGTLAGLGYLNDRAELFVDLVDKDNYPIDNLFAMCFEDTAFIPRDNVSDLLECLKIAHDRFVADRQEIREWNDNLPIDKYIRPYEKERVDNVIIAAPTFTPEDYLNEGNRRGK